MPVDNVGRYQSCQFREIRWPGLQVGVPFIAFTLLSSCAPNLTTAAETPDGKGLDTIEYGGSSLLTSAGIGNSITRALVGGTHDHPKTYDLAQASAFDRAVRDFFATTPELGAAKASSPQTEEARRLNADFAACLAGDDGDENICHLRLGSTDYDNVLGDPASTSLSADAAVLQARLSPRDRASLETILTDLLERIRKRTERGRPNLPPLRPVKVVIGPPGDLNVQATFDSDQLIVGEDVVRHIFLRAFHRAVYNYRKGLAEFELFEDCNLCDGQTRAENAFSLSLRRYVHLSRGLPGLRAHIISNQWFASAVRDGCGSLLTDDDRDKLDEIASTDEEDARQIMSPAEIRRLGSCATDGTVRLSKDDIETYLAELAAADKDPPVTTDSYMPVVAELVSLNAGISAEMAKSLLFLMAHESFHLWVSGNAGPQAEFDADAHAVRVFLAEFPEIDPDRWAGSLRTTNEESDPADLFRTFLGRDPIVLLREMYGGMKSYEKDRLHPPLEARIARISDEITSGRLKFTCEMIDQVDAAQAKAEAGSTVTSPLNGAELGLSASTIPKCTKKEREQ